MKQGTTGHPKVGRLALALGLSRRDTVGLLNLLWEWGWMYAPRGDIGRFDDADIALAVDWPPADAARLIDGLLLTGWLDECQQCRLVVHDIEQHAPEFIRKRLGRGGVAFACVVRPDTGGRTADIVRRSADFGCPGRAGQGREGMGGERSGEGDTIARRKALRVVGHVWPDDFTLTDDLRAWARDGKLDPEFEFAAFRDHHQARGSRFVRWDLAFKGWCRRSKAFATTKGTRP